MILLVDGKNILYRSLYSKTDLSYKGMKTSIYYLFLNTIQSVANKCNASNTIIMLDSGHSFRREIYPDYKKKKNNLDPKILEQILQIKEEYPDFKKILKQLGFATYLRHGLEADDLIASYCKTCNVFNEEIVILSGDEDLYQLLSNKVKIIDPKTKKVKNEKWFKKEYSIDPSLWSLVKAIGGCKSDNVIGVNGVAEKTAIKYLKDELKSSNQAFKDIKEFINEDKAKFNLQLTKLPFQDIKLKLKSTILNEDFFIEFCQKNGFKSFLEEDKFSIFKNKQPKRRKVK